VEDGERVDDLAQIFEHALLRHGGRAGFEIVIPRELLAQRHGHSERSASWSAASRRWRCWWAASAS
jgi:hypothetical protein